jgi:D-glycero-alpha-D-manno-heptose 1-phosphate guanylyltransferase
MIAVNKTQVVLLAGGFGTRIAHLLPTIPKPMAPVAGRPFLEWVIRYCNRFGLTEFVLSTGHLSEVIEAYFASNTIPGTCVTCRKETSPLGTAGGFLNAVEGRAEPEGGWLVANGDSLVLSDPTVLAREARARGWHAALLALQVPDTSRFGTLKVAPDGTLQAFAEKRPGSGLINGGVYWFAPGCRAELPEQRPLSFEFDVFPKLIENGARVGTLPIKAPFIDIGTPASLAEAERFILDNVNCF